MTRLLALVSTMYLFACCAWAGDTVRIAVTTSFENSGIADVLLPEIEADLGIEVQILVVGTGQALRLGRAGDVDAVLVHARAAEEQFVADGFALYRREIMYNDFVIVGPDADPSGIKTSSTAAEAFSEIARSKARFVSRGDDSGTHKAELALWTSANADPSVFGAWFSDVGAGMGAALNAAAGLDAYILSDRASWLAFKNKSNLVVLFEGDAALFNQYTYLPVNSEKHPHIQSELAKAVEDWLTSDRARSLINNFRVEDQQLFTFNADQDASD